jgi:hypothetical protein
VGAGVGVTVGAGVAEEIGVGVAVGVGLTEGIGAGVAVGVGLTEGVGLAGLQAKSNAPMENKSGPNSSLFILCEWVVIRIWRAMQGFFKFLETTLHFFRSFYSAAASAAPSVLCAPVRQDVVPLFENSGTLGHL